ncbi:MAG: polyphenol oxidase family protein [Elusimicrobia bacterium]|nr:polyphenol oxidase family protein [Elusimicrobiota bacterium]
MIIEEKNGLKLLKFENLAGCAGLKVAVSTRAGGVSPVRDTGGFAPKTDGIKPSAETPDLHLQQEPGAFSNGVSPAPCAGLNLGFGADDTPENALSNLKLLCAAVDAPFERTVRMRQAHTANVKVIGPDFNFAAPAASAGENLDALITDLKNVPLLALSADCALTVFYDPARSVLAVSHSGWRGALLNIYAQVIAALKLRYGTKPGEIIVGVSPMISAENYPVKEDFIGKLRAFYPEEVSRKCLRLKNGRHHFNLKELLKYQLAALGVKNYEFIHMCTYADKDLFYSRRRDGENAGRFGLIAWLV